MLSQQLPNLRRRQRRFYVIKSTDQRRGGMTETPYAVYRIFKKKLLLCYAAPRDNFLAMGHNLFNIPVHVCRIDS